MSRLSLSHGLDTLGDRYLPRGLLTDAVLITTGAALVTIGAQVTIPVGNIPITGQTIAVLLVGMTLGALRGALSMFLYALLGLMGLPVFSDGGFGAERLFGATGGYILGYVAMAALVGWVAQRGLDRTFLRASLSGLLGTVVVYAIGLPWIAITNSWDWNDLVELGLGVFLLTDCVKIVLVATAMSASWKQIERSDRTARDHLANIN